MADKDSIEDAAEARLAEIESKLMLADDQIEALNRTVYRQQQHIDRLERELRDLRDQVEGMNAGAAPGTPRDEIPPHY
jgi:SlyX protein